MTKAWKDVPIPVGALESHAVHPQDELRDRARP